MPSHFPAAPAYASLTSSAPGSTTATTSSSTPCTWCTSADRGVATSSTCDQRVRHRRLPRRRGGADRPMGRPGANACTPDARREVITTEVLDTEKKWCENGGTGMYDKPDYHVVS